MVSRDVQRELVRSRGTIAGYRIGGGAGSRYDSGLFDGLLMLIAAVAQQALDYGCKCDGCAHWIQLNKDWGMEDIPYPTAGYRRKVQPTEERRTAYDE